MKILFLCTTEFQLLTALNMKYHMYTEDVADIIVDNYHGEEAALAERIRKTNLFRRVCYVNSQYEKKTLHAYLRGISDGQKSVSLLEALANSFKFAESRIKKIISLEKGSLSVLVHGFDTLHIEEYDEFFAYGSRPITRNLSAYIRNVNKKCKIVQIDEGIGSYWVKNVGGCSSIDACALYNPEVRTIRTPAIKIPKLSRKDESFLKIINFVFEYSEDKRQEVYKNGVIFFDQGVTNPLPKYLQNASALKKIIFHNAYCKHRREENDFNKRTQTTLRLLKTTLDVLGDRQIWIKPHPRSASEALKIFSVFGNRVSIMQHQNVPWEVIALNSVVENNVFLTCNSSSVYMYPSVIDDITNVNKSILLYLVYGFHAGQAFNNYMTNLKRVFFDVFLLPEDENEYKKIIERVSIA